MAIKKGKRMEPFEVQVRFTQLLANLNASVTSATKTAQYAIKYRDMDEDLHSCIIEQLERVRMFQAGETRQMLIRITAPILCISLISSELSMQLPLKMDLELQM
jgi:hypothetical protein